jgi:DNA-binding LacI/PurR family transcriptional regulator
MTALRHRGLRVPEDLSIIAVESTSVIAPLLDPPLTRYVAPGGELGRRAAEALIGRLEGRTGPPTQLLVASSLLEGATMADVPMDRAPLDRLLADHAAAVRGSDPSEHALADRTPEHA